MGEVLIKVEFGVFDMDELDDAVIVARYFPSTGTYMAAIIEVESGFPFMVYKFASAEAFQKTVFPNGETFSKRQVEYVKTYYIGEEDEDI